MARLTAPGFESTDPVKPIGNDASRHALAPRMSRQWPYRLTPHQSAVRPGLDPTGFTRLPDELEDEALLDDQRHTA
ncbi:hypothetical protein SAMN05421810_102677 [Amycolatopsis arida]|uniref:Uncharacterized protein n=1 Tax=Amycolatopsis arida TaxID=587909 RepID=A0A1I5QKW2_9PSEU|nr:hypothetical protein CLV69_101678 [Amycolatopsis arida]SFP46862.1 hypothetical protein SAMN05421810_102677 [Amycolatopsis arida]